MGKGLRLAVAAPGCVELDQDVLLIVQDDVFVVVRDDDLDGPFLSFWNRLRLDAGRDLAGQKVVDELADALFGELGALIEGELLVLDGLLDGEGGPLGGVEVEVLAVLAEGFGVDRGEVDLALVFLGNGLELFGEGFALFRGFGEDVGEGEAGLE